ANGIFLVLLFAGGVVVPASALPAWLGAIVQWLPSAALGDSLRTLLAAAPGAMGMDLGLLIAWAALGVLIAARTFKWD
ncbi:MAG: ABC transporter permease, partial [Actinomycetota bacterium]